MSLRVHMQLDAMTLLLGEVRKREDGTFDIVLGTNEEIAGAGTMDDLRGAGLDDPVALQESDHTAYVTPFGSFVRRDQRWVLVEG